MEKRNPQSLVKLTAIKMHICTQITVITITVVSISKIAKNVIIAVNSLSPLSVKIEINSMEHAITAKRLKTVS